MTWNRPPFDALQSSARLAHDKPANEVLRAAVLNGELHVSLRRGVRRSGRLGLCSSRPRARRALLRAREDVQRAETLERIRAPSRSDAPAAEGISRPPTFNQ
jgi:hypothetical protein